MWIVSRIVHIGLELLQSLFGQLLLSILPLKLLVVQLLVSLLPFKLLVVQLPLSILPFNLLVLRYLSNGMFGSIARHTSDLDIELFKVKNVDIVPIKCELIEDIHSFKIGATLTS